MGSPAKAPLSWARRLGVLLIVGASVFSLIAASAASLGGMSTVQIYAESHSVSIPVPTVVASDDFSSCSGRLHGETDALGNVWTEHWGRWVCRGGDIVQAQWRLPLSNASVDIGRNDHLIITTTAQNISNAPNRSGAGISLFTTGFFHLYSIYERDQDRVTLGKWTPWANVVLTSVPISDLSAMTMSVIVDQPSLTVLVNGSHVLTYDLNNLTPQEHALLLGNTRFGLSSDADNTSRFDSFRIEVLP